MSLQPLRSYKDGYRFVTVQNPFWYGGIFFQFNNSSVIIGQQCCLEPVPLHNGKAIITVAIRYVVSKGSKVPLYEVGECGIHY